MQVHDAPGASVVLKLTKEAVLLKLPILWP